MRSISTRDRARYLADRATDVRVTGAEGIDAVMKRERLDALMFPGSAGAAVAAKPGYPTVIVPFGFVPNAPTAAISIGVRSRSRRLLASASPVARAASRGSSQSLMPSNRRRNGVCHRRNFRSMIGVV